MVPTAVLAMAHSLQMMPCLCARREGACPRAETARCLRSPGSRSLPWMPALSSCSPFNTSNLPWSDSHDPCSKCIFSSSRALAKKAEGGHHSGSPVGIRGACTLPLPGLLGVAGTPTHRGDRAMPACPRQCEHKVPISSGEEWMACRSLIADTSKNRFISAPQ